MGPAQQAQPTTDAHPILVGTGNSDWAIDRLKETILQLAVMGRLVEQNKNDEPASALLKRIEAEKAQLVKDGKIKKPQILTVENSLSITPPSDWEVVLLNEVAFVTKLAGFEYTKYLSLQDDGEVPVIRAQNVRPFNPDLTNLKFIDAATSELLERSAITQPCLLVTFIGAGIGDVCVLAKSRRYHLAPNVAKIEPYGTLNLRFLNFFLASPSGQIELFKSMKSTAQPSLSMTSLREMWMPIPPLAEQQRIVERVDQLFALCDQLKAKQQDANQTQQQLTEALVERALG